MSEDNLFPMKAMIESSEKLLSVGFNVNLDDMWKSWGYNEKGGAVNY